MTGLIRYDAMCQAITECFTIDEVKELRSKAKALEVYAKVAMNFEAERQAAKIRIRAERRAGELLIQMKENDERQRGGRPSKPSQAARVKDFNLNYNQSSDWQKLAAIPAEEFEEALNFDGPPVSTRALVLAHEKKTAPTDKPVPTDALWLCGILQELADFFQEKDITLLLSQMTETMRSDVFRISPQLANCLQEITHENERIRRTANRHRAS